MYQVGNAFKQLIIGWNDLLVFSQNLKLERRVYHIKHCIKQIIKWTMKGDFRRSRSRSQTLLQARCKWSTPCYTFFIRVCYPRDVIIVSPITVISLTIIPAASSDIRVWLSWLVSRPSASVHCFGTLISHFWAYNITHALNIKFVDLDQIECYKSSCLVCSGVWGKKDETVLGPFLLCTAEYTAS